MLKPIFLECYGSVGQIMFWVPKIQMQQILPYKKLKQAKLLRKTCKQIQIHSHDGVSFAKKKKLI